MDHAKFDRSSFRYEVKVTTPHFEIATMDECEQRSTFTRTDDERPSKWLVLFTNKVSRDLISPFVPVALLGTSISRIGTFCQFDHFSNEYWNGISRSARDRARAIILSAIGIGEDGSSWLNLLEDIHQTQHEYHAGNTSDLSQVIWGNAALMCISSKFIHIKRIWNIGLISCLRLYRKNAFLGLHAARYRAARRQYHAWLFDYHGISFGYDLDRFPTQRGPHARNGWGTKLLHIDRTWYGTGS